MKTNKKIALGYARTAAEGQPGIELQRKAIEEFAKNNGYDITIWIEHSKRSGVDSNFDWLHESLENNKEIRFLLIHKVDRLSRSTSKLIALEKYLKEEYNVVVDVAKKTALPYFKTNEQYESEGLEPRQAAAAFMQSVNRLVSNQGDDYEETWTLTHVYESENFYEISQKGMTCCLDKQYGVIPKVGDKLTIYTKGGRFGSIRGMDLNDERIFWNADEELE